MRYPMIPLKDQEPNRYDDPQVLVGDGEYQRAINLRGNRTRQLSRSLERMEDAVMIPHSISAIVSDAILHMGAGTFTLSLVGILQVLGVFAIAWGLFALVFLTYFFVLLTVALNNKRMIPIVFYRIMLLLLSVYIFNGDAYVLDFRTEPIKPPSQPTVSRPLE